MLLLMSLLFLLMSRMFFGGKHGGGRGQIVVASSKNDGSFRIFRRSCRGFSASVVVVEDLPTPRWSGDAPLL